MKIMSRSPESINPEKPSFHLISRLKPIPGIGVAFATFSGILFAFSTSMVKFLNTINPFEILFVRSIVQMLIYLLIMIFKKDDIRGAPGERLWRTIDNLVGFVFLGLAYVAVHLISLGDSSAIIFSSSVYATIFARFILAEPCNLINLFCLLLVISGVLLISRPTFLFGVTLYTYSSSDRTLGLVLSLVASLSAALYYVLLKKLAKTAVSVTMFWFSLTVALLSLLVVTIQGELSLPTTVTQWTLIIGNGFIGTGGLLLLGLALKLEDAGPVSLARTIDIVVAFIIQVTLLHDPAPWTSIVGSVIIVLGVATSAMRHFIMAKVASLRKNSQLSMPPSTINPVNTVNQRQALVPTISVTQH